MKTTTLYSRCCSILLCSFIYVVFCAPIQAQKMSDVPSKWLLGHDTIIIPEGLRKAISNRAKDFDTTHIKENIVPIMLMLEWVKNQCTNIDEHIPAEYCYLALCKNYLTDHKHTQSNVLVQANTKFWNLTETTLKELQLEHELHRTDDADDASHLYLSTLKMVGVFKQANAYFQNWALTMLVIDHGYEGTKKRVREYYESDTKRYKQNQHHTFALDLYSNIWIEYFALRYVLEPIIIKQKEPQKYLTCKTVEKPFSIKSVPKNFQHNIHDLPVYNRWLKTDKKKVPKDMVQHWFVAESRQSLSHPYPYPKLYLFKPSKQKPEEKKQQPEESLIIIPEKQENIVFTNTTSDKFTNEIQHLHIVRKGETLFAIAKLYAISIEQLRDLNPDKKHTSNLAIADVLIIRARTQDEYQNIKRSKKHKKLETLMQGENAHAKSYQFKKEKIRSQERSMQAINPQTQRGAVHRYPARLTPTESKQKKAYHRINK